MKFRWRKNRHFTFVIIPDANRSVIRLRLSEYAAILIPFVLLAIVCVALVCYVLYLKSLVNQDKLAKQLDAQKSYYKSLVSVKDETIKKLEQDLVQLSMQAEEVQQKMNVLKKLEQELNGNTREAKAQQSVSVASLEQHLPSGGIYHPLTEEEFSEFIKETESHFSKLSEEADLLADKLEETARKIKEQRYLERITPNIWPTRNRYVTSGFGYRIDPFTRRYSFHSGIDIQGRVNDPVYSTAEGVVVEAGRDSGRGNYVIVNHTRGIRTVYMHLNKILVNKGDKVEKGQKIGLVGSTGRSTGPHLHYEVERYGVSVNPWNYLQ